MTHHHHHEHHQDDDASLSPSQRTEDDYAETESAEESDAADASKKAGSTNPAAGDFDEGVSEDVEKAFEPDA